MGAVPRRRGVLNAEETTEAPRIGIGREEPVGPSPLLAAALAVLVAVAVFAFIWKLRKTFGMQE